MVNFNGFDRGVIGCRTLLCAIYQKKMQMPVSLLKKCKNPFQTSMCALRSLEWN